MHLLVPLASLLGIEVQSLAARARMLAVVYGLVAVFAATGLGFGVAALFMLIAAEIGPLWAALSMAGGFILLALALLLGVRIGDGRRKRRAVARRRSSEAGAFVTTAAISALPVLLRSPLIVKLGVPAAALAALAYLTSRDDPEEP